MLIGCTFIQTKAYSTSRQFRRTLSVWTARHCVAAYVIERQAFAKSDTIHSVLCIRFTDILLVRSKSNGQYYCFLDKHNETLLSLVIRGVKYRGSGCREGKLFFVFNGGRLCYWKLCYSHDFYWDDTHTHTNR